MNRITKLGMLLALLLVLAIPAHATDDAQFSVTVPAALPITVDASGSVSVSDSARIENHSVAPVKLSAIRIESQNNWEIEPWSTDYSEAAVDSKGFSLQLNGVGVPSTGVVDVSGYDAIASGANAALTYNAKLAAQSEARSETIANVVFTVSWDGHGPLSSIAVTTAPTKTEYNIGDAFNSRGMVVTATYADGTTATASGWTVTNGASLAEGQTSVTVSYSEGGVTRTTTTPITVNAKQLSYIVVKTAPNRTSYNTGSSFDKTGMEVLAYYNNYSSAVVTDFSVSGTLTNNNMDGSVVYCQVTVSYTEGGITATTQYPVQVFNALRSITIAQNPNKTVYSLGEIFDPTGMVVVANFTSGSKVVPYSREKPAIDCYTLLEDPDKPMYYGQNCVVITYEIGNYYVAAEVPVTVTLY